jgi:hypothetical protein
MLRRIVLIASLSLLQQQTLQDGKGAIQGNALRSDNREPISGVRIAVQPVSASGVSFTTTTDKAGRFTIGDLPPGNYALRAELDGFLREGDIPAFLPTYVNVGQQQVVVVGPLKFLPVAAIEGRILNSDRTAASDMSVELLRKSYSSDTGALEWQVVTTSQTQTDDRGHYRFFSLGPGTYYLRAVKRPKTLGGIVDTGNLAVVTSKTYFPGVISATSAIPLVIKPGDDITADFTIPFADSFRVSGVVINELPNTRSLPQTSLVLVPLDMGAPRESQSQSHLILNLPMGSDGRFELRGIHPGTYELSAISTALPAQTAPEPSENHMIVGRTPFTIADKDKEDINIVLRPGVDVSGKLTIVGDPAGFYLFQSKGGGAGAIVGTQVNLRLFSTDDSPVGTILPPRISGSTFLFPNIPEGKYLVTASIAGAQRAAYVADIRQGAESILDESIIVGTQAPEPLEIIVDTNGGSLSASIDGKTENSVQLILEPQAPHLNTQLRYKAATADPIRPTDFSRIAPGNYSLYAREYAAGSSVPYLDPEFLSKYQLKSVAVRVTAGIKLTGIVVPLIRIGQ